MLRKTTSKDRVTEKQERQTKKEKGIYELKEKLRAEQERETMNTKYFVLYYIALLVCES